MVTNNGCYTLTGLIAALMIAHGAAAGTLDLPVDRPVSVSVMALARQCAPEVHPLTMAYLVARESSSQRYAINVNGGASFYPATLEAATEIAERLVSAGENFDIGYGQINSGNFSWVGASAAELLDGCRNLAASQQVLSYCYERAYHPGMNPQTALRDALSCYNTGDPEKGHQNGYVASVESLANRHRIPELLPVTSTAVPDPPPAEPSEETAAFPNGPGDAFSHGTRDAFESGGTGHSVN